MKNIDGKQTNMKTLLQRTMLFVTLAFAGNAYSADSQTVNIRGQLAASPCDVSFSVEEINFGQINYDKVHNVELAAAQPPGLGQYRPSRMSAVATPITVTYECGARGNIQASFEDSIPSPANEHGRNNVYDSEMVQGFTMRDTENNAVGIMVFQSDDDDLLRTYADGARGTNNRIFNYNKGSSNLTGTLMGPLAISPQAPVKWHVTPILYLNAQRLDPAEQTKIIGSINVTLQL